MANAPSHTPPSQPRSKRSAPIYPRELPSHGYARLKTVLAVVPVAKSTWWKGIKDGRFPAGVKIGPRVTVWKVEEIRALLDRIAQGHVAA